MSWVRGLEELRGPEGPGALCRGHGSQGSAGAPATRQKRVENEVLLLEDINEKCEKMAQNLWHSTQKALSFINVIFLCS